MNSRSSGNNNFGLAMTFTVVGDQIAAGGSTQIPCGSSGSVGSGAVITGSAGADGSFSAQTSATQPADVLTLQIKGTVPSGSGSSWIGSYTFSNTDPSCPFTSSGPITAVRIADLTGTYSGSASLSPPFGTTGTAQPVSLSFTLQQGQAVSGPAGTQSVDEGILSGSVKGRALPASHRPDRLIDTGSGRKHPRHERLCNLHDGRRFTPVDHRKRRGHRVQQARGCEWADLRREVRWTVHRVVRNFTPIAV